MALHTLKTWPGPFQALFDGVKRFEWRRDDREPRYEVGDKLYLREWVPDKLLPNYTGRMVTATVCYLLRGPDFGVPEGYVIMSLDNVHRYRNGEY